MPGLRIQIHGLFSTGACTLLYQLNYMYSVSTELGSREVAVVRALAFHQCGPGFLPGLGIKWVEFVGGSRPCSKRFFSGYSGFPLYSKTNNFQILVRSGE